jgi:hypothetical protein
MTQERAVMIARDLIRKQALAYIGDVCAVVYLAEEQRNIWAVSFSYNMPDELKLDDPSSLTILVDDETGDARVLPSPWDLSR